MRRRGREEDRRREDKVRTGGQREGRRLRRRGGQEDRTRR